MGVSHAAQIRDEEQELTELYRSQPWSTYAVQLTTLSPPALVGDLLLWFTLTRATLDWSSSDRLALFYALATWMTFSKFVKLITHFVRFPVDAFLWPVSVLFGWYHGIIKMHAMFTLSEVSYIRNKIDGLRLTKLQTTWGSRAGADASDSERMIRQNQKLYEQNLLFNEKVSNYEKAPLMHDFTNTQAVAAWYDLDSALQDLIALIEIISALHELCLQSAMWTTFCRQKYDWLLRSRGTISGFLCGWYSSSQKVTVSQEAKVWLHDYFGFSSTQPGKLGGNMGGKRLQLDHGMYKTWDFARLFRDMQLMSSWLCKMLLQGGCF